ncbi:hypothetical protein NQ317_013242, partial [Molorchus minor]
EQTYGVDYYVAWAFLKLGLPKEDYNCEATEADRLHIHWISSAKTIGTGCVIICGRTFPTLCSGKVHIQKTQDTQSLPEQVLAVQVEVEIRTMKGSNHDHRCLTACQINVYYVPGPHTLIIDKMDR